MTLHDMDDIVSELREFSSKLGLSYGNDVSGKLDKIGDKLSSSRYESVSDKLDNVIDLFERIERKL